jgi:hypothetical protein
MSVTQRTLHHKTRFVVHSGHRCNAQVNPRPAAETAPVELALAPALRLRLLGTGLVAVGVVVTAGVLLMWLVHATAALVTGLVVLGAVGVVALGLLLGLRHWVVRLDQHGYRVRGLRPQARAARWSDVLDLQAVNVTGHRCVVLRLRDGRTTVLPVDAVEGGPVRLTELITAHLDGTHGYRRLR